MKFAFTGKKNYNITAIKTNREKELAKLHDENLDKVLTKVRHLRDVHGIVLTEESYNRKGTEVELIFASENEGFIDFIKSLEIYLSKEYDELLKITLQR